MIYLYMKIDNDKYYYNKETTTFVVDKLKATLFHSIQDISNVIRDNKYIYDFINRLSYEYISYWIYVKDSPYSLGNEWESLEETIKICDRLNEGLNKKVFCIQENITQDKPYNNLLL